MMSNQGHIPDEWIVSYAAGALGEAHALLVATHVDFHPDLQQKVGQAEEIGGVLLGKGEPIAVNDNMLDAVLQQIDALDGDSDDNAVDAADDTPQPLHAYLGQSLEDLNWRTMGPGMKQVRLWSGDKGEQLWLLKAKGGTKIPAHDHGGAEMTLVLKGSYHVGEAQFTPGMLEMADIDDTNHHPVIDEGEDCICLVVTEAPIKLHSFVGRLAQPFIGL